MKKIFLIILIILTGSQFVKADNTPAITIECKYVNASDTTHFVKLKSDNEFCCNFIVTSILNSNENITLIKHTRTGVVLGTIYGRPSKEFIMDICRKNNFLDQDNVDKIAESMLKFKNN
jgi:hypothetical protein